MKKLPQRFYVFLNLLKKAFLPASPGSMTVEAAVAAPLFAAAMAAVIQFGNVYGTAVRVGSTLAQTGEELAIAAYTTEYTGQDSPVPAVLSVAYASGKVSSGAGDQDCIRNKSFLLSGIMDEDEKVDLVMTYQVRSPGGLIRIPGIVFVQRAAVRGWVGRNGSGSAGEDAQEEPEEHQTVYVTDYGTVYHTDPDCTHIHLSIRQVSEAEAAAARNVYGEKYHACEKCGGTCGGCVYITTDGNCYHSSLECSGLKRTVQEMDIEDIGDLRPCSKCAANVPHEH